MHLELDGEGPLHAQLARALRSILNGSVAGTRLPSSRQLAHELRISRNTVVAAYEQLRLEGVIEMRAASGVFVAQGATRCARPAAVPAGNLEPQSRYARRARRYHDHDLLPSHRIPDVRYSFDVSMPSTNPVLTTAWSRALARAAAYTSPFNAHAQGVPILREAICELLMRRRGVVATPDDVLVVGGTQQAISLSARVLIDEGEEVAIEEPQYFAIRQVLQAHGARIVGVPVDSEGIRSDLLPESPPRMVCVTPSHQFPSGAIMSMARRRRLLDYAAQKDCWIFEDDYDGEFRYGTPALAPLRSLDEGNRVIYVGTFSKSMFPALRLGYLVMPPQLRRDFIAAKWLHDFGSPAIEQVALANFITDGSFDRHMLRSSEALEARRHALIDGLRRQAGDRIEIADSHAGMHLLVWLRNRSRAQGALFRGLAQKRGLGIAPVDPEYIDPPDRAGLLFKFAAVSLQDIRDAIPIFVECLDALEQMQVALVD